MARLMESLFLKGPAGRLEALLETPENGEPREAVLVCHPHPQHGGTMHTKAVYRMARGLRRSGSVVLRFHFRGVHLSEGAYDHGEGELEDARAALVFLRDRYPDLPFAVAGFSFGSLIALRLGCEYPECARIIAAGFPLRLDDPRLPSRCRIPRYFVQSTHDEWGPRAALQTFYDQLKGPKRIMWVAAKDHFFSGALNLLEETITRL